MKKILLSFMALALCAPTFAQELPQPSPAATVQQRVGLTDIKVEYSRPSRKDRKIFGKLVPYNTLWRTGANRNTMLTLSTDAKIGGREVKAGTYSLFTIPTENSWTVILNKNIDLWGTDGYSEEMDVLRIKVPVKQNQMVETMTIAFNDVAPSSANMVLAWEGQMIEIPIMVDSESQAIENIKKAMAESKEEDLWRVYRNSANYYVQNDMSLEEAAKMMAKSLELKDDSWYSHYMMGTILAKMGKHKEALKSGKKALKIGTDQAKEAEKEFGYADMIAGAMAEWKAAMK
jgi:hypothetical protein